MNSQLSQPTYKSHRINVDGGPPLNVLFQCSNGEITQVQLSHSSHFQFQIEGDTSIEDRIVDWMEAYSRNKKHPLPPLNLCHLSPFMLQVLQGIQEIPIGQTFSYKKLAESIGRPRGARAVGTGCGRNPFPLLIPCHRVVASNGALGGYTPDISLKKAILSYERVLAS